MFSSTRLAGLALCLAATFAALAPAQVAASRGRGLTQFYDSTFYRNLDKHRFYRKNVNNLDALLKLVVNGPIVSTTVLNRGYKEFAANWHYAISRFGRVRDIIAVTFDGESLIECLNLGFACYNGTNLLPASEQLHPDDVTHGNEHFYRLNWGKVVFVNALLTRQYDVFLSDLDTVWLKDAHRTMVMALDKYDADVVAMNDGGGGNPNVGNMLFRHNNRTLSLVGTWAARALQNSTGRPLVRKDQQEQAHMWTMKDTHWGACNSPTECAAVKAQGKAAMWLHPWHGCPWEHFEYSKARWAGKICDNELAYLHIFCTAGGTPHKTEMATKIGVWFVDPEARSPIMRGASSWELVDMPETHPIKDSMPLPCPNEVAWV